MITILTGSAGSGKTFIMVRLIKKRWKKGENIFTNFPLWYDEDHTRVQRWHRLEETYNLKQGILTIDESQKLLDARNWNLLPASFRDKIAMHRHHHLDIFTTTQDLGHIDLRMRSNAHRVIACRSLFRFPTNQNLKPLFQIVRATVKERNFDGESGRVGWQKSGHKKHFFISRLWSRTYYDTYGEVGSPKFLCKMYRRGGKWFGRIYARDLVENGKARL